MHVELANIETSEHLAVCRAICPACEFGIPETLESTDSGSSFVHSLPRTDFRMTCLANIYRQARAAVLNAGDDRRAHMFEPANAKVQAQVAPRHSIWPFNLARQPLTEEGQKAWDAAQASELVWPIALAQPVYGPIWPLFEGWIYVFEFWDRAGRLKPVQTYSDKDCTVANNTPIILNCDGYSGPIFVKGVPSVTVQIRDRDGHFVASFDAHAPGNPRNLK